MSQSIEYAEHDGALPPALIARIGELLVACFGEPFPRFRQRLHGKPDLHLVLATDGERAVGFKLSYRRGQDECYSWLGGVHPDYRRRGIARALMRQQHAWAHGAGYQSVTTEPENRYRSMLILDLQEGFEIVGTYFHDSGQLRILLRKALASGVNDVDLATRESGPVLS